MSSAADPSPRSPLISVEELVGLLDDPDVRIVDCRFSLTDADAGRRWFAEGHPPGALHFSLDDDLSAARGPGRHPLPSPQDFAATLGHNGIGNAQTVIAYDDGSSLLAPRLWWMLRSLGHDKAFVLDGGWAAWVAADAPVSTASPIPKPTTFNAPGEWSGTIDRDRLATRLGAVPLIDARAGSRYRGETEPLDAAAGHIPTAVNLPFAANLDRSGRFLPASALAERYAEVAGSTPVVYCGSGVSACSDILAMEIAGIPATLYPGSWSDWSAHDLPVATGADPGTAGD